MSRTPDGRGCLRRSMVSCCIAGVFVPVFGCRGQADPRAPRVPFKARVVLDDQPVVAAVVVLSPQDGGHAATGISDSDGKVVFSTFGSQDGVVPGRYAVMISKTETNSVEGISSDDPSYDPAKAAAAQRPARDLLPSRYTSPATSGLTIEVPAAAGEPEVFRLTK
jgi:hypothetical protein